MYKVNSLQLVNTKNNGNKICLIHQIWHNNSKALNRRMLLYGCKVFNKTKNIFNNSFTANEIIDRKPKLNHKFNKLFKVRDINNFQIEV